MPEPNDGPPTVPPGVCSCVGWFAVGTCVLFREVTTFTVASNEFIGGGKEKTEYQRNAAVYPSVITLRPFRWAW